MLLACGAIPLFAEPWIWLKNPDKTNFNAPVSWVGASGGKAAALRPDRNLPDKPFFEYHFNCASAGKYRVWGRTFDPAWSSPGRWRIDGKEWQKWTPAKRVDRIVTGKHFPLDWCSWGEIELTAGPHVLRFEPQGKRPYGDYAYFVQDSLLITKDLAYKPSGKIPGPELAAELKGKIEKLTGNGSHEAKTAERLVRESVSDSSALKKLQKMEEELRRDRTTLPKDDGQALLLNFYLEKVRQNGGKIEFHLTSDIPFSGKLLVLFLKDNALYAVLPYEMKKPAKRLAFSEKMPKGLPSGKIEVTVYPLHTPFGSVESGSFQNEGDGKVNQPLSWGAYRSSTGIRHVWYVTPANVLMWDGEPYIPFGGMVNTRLSWMSNGRSGLDSKLMKEGKKMLEGRLDQLLSYGIRDIYFNGFFPKGNTNLLRWAVNLAEQKKMFYGLHIAYFPKKYDMGFIRESYYERPLPKGASEFTFKVTDYPPSEMHRNKKGKERLAKQMKDVPLPCRIIYSVTNAAGESVEAGILKTEADGTVKLRFKNPVKAGDRLTYLQEKPMDRSDPAGYLSSLGEYQRLVKATYGTLPLGDHLRFFIDPLKNEMNFVRPTGIPVGEEFRRKRLQFLAERYGSTENMNKLCNALDGGVPDFRTAARLVPVADNTLTSCWIDPENGKLYRFRDRNSQMLRDLKEIRGKVCRDVINSVVGTLKSIADVPVLLKHNTWFSDWFVDPLTKPGFDGIGMEAYCYGDSLAYHNSAVVYAEIMQTKRSQWCAVTESSAAAFEGQKNYCGYIDRLQMIHDIDQLMMLGAKGFWHFGLMFDPNPRSFFTTEITRDPRQLEWLVTHRGIYRNAGEKYLKQRPGYYGWYPGYLREGEAAGRSPRLFDIDGHYMGTSAQIRMAPDGRWIVPAIDPKAPFRSLIAVEPFMTVLQQKEMEGVKAIRLTNENLNGFTAHGIGIIPPEKGNPDRIQEFRKNILGTEVFQTDALNGLKFPDGKLLVWVCVEKNEADVKLPATARVFDLKGKEITVKDGRLHLKREPYEKAKEETRPAHITSGYHYLDNGQPETVYLHGVSINELVRLNKPAFYRWLPAKTSPSNVKVFCEAEHFSKTTFTQPSIEGYSRYSGGRAVGINSHWDPPKGKFYETEYDFVLDSPVRNAVFRLRKQVSPSLKLEVLLDGRKVGTIDAEAPCSDSMHLSPWNAGLSKNDIKVGYVSLPLGKVQKGRHTLTIRALGTSPGYARDSKLMGGEAEKSIGVTREIPVMRALQLDCWLIEETAN